MSSESEVIWKQGAEGRLFRGTYLGSPCIIKERFKKEYRHPSLDESLTKERIKNEIKSMVKCRQAGVHAPTVYSVDFERRRVVMENIEPCLTSKEFMLELLSSQKEEIIQELGKEIGCVIGKIHNVDIIHGDLTTSNILVRRNQSGFKLTLIDFGLSYMEQSAEDKAVDLYVLERAICSTFPSASRINDSILIAYGKENRKNGKHVLQKLEEVRLRGRKRLMLG